jgi:NTE family protein
VKINKNLKYALTLSGGGARGLVHVGVLCALEAAGYPLPSLIAGTSMGAVVGGLYASGMSSAGLKAFVIDELDFTDFMESPGFKLSGTLGKLLVTGQFIGAFATRPGVDSGKKALALLERFAQCGRIEECPIPFICNAVDLVSGREVIFSSGPLAPAIRASMSFPVFFEPCAGEGMCLVDGGIIDNMPVAAAREAGRALGVSRVLAVDTRNEWREVPAVNYRNGAAVVLRCFDVLLHAAERNKARAELTLFAADRSSVVEFERKKELVALGEAAVERAAPELNAFFGSGPRAYFARRKRGTCGIRMEGKYTEPESRTD